MIFMCFLLFSEKNFNVFLELLEIIPSFLNLKLLEISAEYLTGLT